MSLPAPVADRLGLLIPRLASDHDGEVVATVKAIRRTLASERLDLHDLARSLAPIPQSRPWPRWSRLAYNEKVMALDAIDALRMSPWEQEFVANIGETLRGNPYIHLTQKQEAVLDRLLARASGGSR